MINLFKSKKIKSDTLWAIEDVNEYTYFASYNKEELVDFINNSTKILENDQSYLVCVYPSRDSIVPEHVQTVRTFLIPTI